MNDKIWQWIGDYCSGLMDKSEEQELRAWMDEAEENKLFFMEGVKMVREYQVVTRSDKNASDSLKHVREKIKARGRRQLWIQITAVASVVILFALSFAFFYMPELERESPVSAKVHAGGMKATLIVANGIQVDLMQDNLQDVVRQYGATVLEDKKNELKENSIRNKQHMMNKHIVPYFGTRKMNEITPAEIIQWQNTIQEKGYSKTYERMIQNQLNALFNHAQKIYNLKENPCKKVKKMGKSDANKLEFWTKAEYDSFIAGIEPESEDYLIFEILFWTGIREGELLALSLSDFDMSGNLLHINKTYNRIRKRDVIDTPKTENSVRTIDIPNFLKEEVQEYAKKHYGFPENQRLFPIVARTLQKRLKKYEALTGVKPIRVHDIRHSKKKVAEMLDNKR